MEPRSLQFLTLASGGELLRGAPSVPVSDICTDSRQPQPGGLFVPLHGERFDGHDFIAQAVEYGAMAVMSERSRVGSVPGNVAVIAVDDTTLALGHLAARYREDFDVPVISVAGSNGKTTTKELVAAICGRQVPTLASEASFNNQVGVPRTLLKFERKHGVAVLEAGTNHPGELAPLLRMIRPRLGILTSLGREHLEFFGDLDGVVEEEGVLGAILPPGGTLIINGDTPGWQKISARSMAPVVRAGFGAHNDWCGEITALDARGSTLCVWAPRREWCGNFRVNLLGRHNALNALLALATAAEIGIQPELAREALTECQVTRMRLQPREVAGIRLVDDTYNANADSMLAALQTLYDLPCAGRRVAVLGDMAELGRHAEAAHVEVGSFAAKLGIHRLVAIGRLAGPTVRAARAGGLAEAVSFDTQEDAGNELTGWLRAGDVVLLKGSRSARLEKLVARLETELTARTIPDADSNAGRPPEARRTPETDSSSSPTHTTPTLAQVCAPLLAVG
jgi:UDP-N-acetylmuramoyl-tripeptide--D-alanyl-D-alanine ligase